MQIYEKCSCIIWRKIFSGECRVVPCGRMDRWIRRCLKSVFSISRTCLKIQHSDPRVYCPFKAYWSRDAPTSLTFNNCTLCPHCIYVFCVYLRTNSDLCHLQHKLIGFYNRDEKCLQRGTDWVFKYCGLRFVCKGLLVMCFVFIWE